MKTSINKVTLIGNLVNNPTIKEEGTNKMASFSLATSEEYTDKDKNKKEAVEWHNIVAFGGFVNSCKKLTKGSQVYIEGQLATRQYTKDGVNHFITEIRVKELRFLNLK